MKAERKIFIAPSDSSEDDLHPAFVEKLAERGGAIERVAHGRLIISAPIAKAEIVEEWLRSDDEDLEVDPAEMTVYTLPKPSGQSLEVEILYHDNEQLSTVLVDERLFAAMVAEEGWFNHEEFKGTPAANDAVAYLVKPDMIFELSAPGEEFDIKHVGNGKLFDPRPVVTWDPEMWGEDEPMAEITFTAQAVLANDHDLVEVIIPGTETSTMTWEIPARLVPPPHPQVHHDDLALTPAAPAEVRAWAAIAPFRLEVEMPEPEAENTFGL